VEPDLGKVSNVEEGADIVEAVAIGKRAHHSLRNEARDDRVLHLYQT
jgi:hypothetical protein